MKRLIQTIRNINKIEDLKKRILYTLGIILIYRLGTQIVLPGIDPNILRELNDQASSSGGLVELLNIFSGGAFSNASIFALGIMPYISASIVIQLLGMAIPYFQKLQKEGESGRRKINQITRYFNCSDYWFPGSGLYRNNGCFPYACRSCYPFYSRWISIGFLLGLISINLNCWYHVYHVAGRAYYR